MKAMILAAGRGLRMRPLSDHKPKPLLEIASKPMIVYHLERLACAGYRDIVINIAHLGWKIQQELGDGSRWRLQLHYSDEGNHALEIAGGIKQALPLLGDAPFLVVNGDIWCDYACTPVDFSDGDLGHLVLVDNPPHNAGGDFALIGSRARQRGQPRYTFAGIGYYRPELFHALEAGKQALAPLLRRAICKNRISAQHYAGIWHDIGTPERWRYINQKVSA